MSKTIKTYDVYHHDHFGNASVNRQQGFHVKLHGNEGFRDFPITSLIWSETVEATDKDQAIAQAKLIRNNNRIVLRK